MKTTMQGWLSLIVKNGGESDTDCGGTTSCPRCASNRACTLPSDCASSVCSNAVCQTPTCSDTVKNGNETDTDCGGETCATCGLGKTCSGNTDCASGICSAGKCVSCSDGAKNGTETDVDCGGPSCGKCGDAKTCGGNTDCASGICVAGKCAVCNPGAAQCSTTNAPQTCDATGHWTTGATCGGATPQCCQGGCIATVAQVSAGGTHICAVKTDGTLWCWGNNNYGQLGDGTTTTRKTPVQVITLGTSVVEVSAGNGSTCARKADGTLWCWGFNNYGQLGDGTNTNQPTPVAVSSLGNNVAHVSVGFYDSACALKTDGTVWCWGVNNQGQLGDGTTTNSSVPVRAGQSTLGSSVAQVSVGNWHACARLADGTLWCWGAGAEGELGIGTTSAHATPVEVTGLGNTVANVSAGAKHTCASKTDGTGWCWGYNSTGQIGDGTTTNRTSPVQVISEVASFAAGGFHTCARKTDGTLWCWGGNNFGAVGDGSLIDRPLPMAVSSLGNTVTAASAELNLTCAVRTDSTLWCWGFNFSGQLGDGSSLKARPLPMRNPLGVCSSDQCNNGTKDSTEADIDCGGSCLAYGLVCADGKACGGGADCDAVLSYCNAGVCKSTCSNGVQDGLETGVDCGGPYCSGC